MGSTMGSMGSLWEDDLATVCDFLVVSRGLGLLARVRRVCRGRWLGGILIGWGEDSLTLGGRLD